ncbi:MAG: hypothetical protein BJ554DRAFT_6235 [Olpidium bornovanus]|uniref:Uncharacterized protein n=1 Tax=Olpidium bornovanus TaxID=278681 RepID=A0A8H7ZYX6_9FUNG|nr:MAG: hypothetical protein BJ554DRAFT_6235 [Olpidium bornovanus]
MPSPRRRRRCGSGTPAPDPGTSGAEPPSTALPLAALSIAPSMATLSTAPATTALAPAVSSNEPMLDLPLRTVPVFGWAEVPLPPTIFSVADVDLTALSTLKRQHAFMWHESATTTVGIDGATVIFRDFAPAIDAVVADHSVLLADLTIALRELEPAVMEAATVYRRKHGTLGRLRQTLTSANPRLRRAYRSGRRHRPSRSGPGGQRPRPACGRMPSSCPLSVGDVIVRFVEAFVEVRRTLLLGVVFVVRPIDVDSIAHRVTVP